MFVETVSYLFTDRSQNGRLSIATAGHWPAFLTRGLAATGGGFDASAARVWDGVPDAEWTASEPGGLQRTLASRDSTWPPPMYRSTPARRTHLALIGWLIWRDWRNKLGKLTLLSDNWQLSLLNTHLQLESWIAEYIQWHISSEICKTCKNVRTAKKTNS